MNSDLSRPLELDDAARAACAWIDDQAEGMIARTKAWSLINSGSRNAQGLEAMRTELATAYGPLDGRIEAVDLTPSEVVEASGEIRRVEHPPALRVRQRPDAAIQIALTGHHDTVFAVDSAFQDWRAIDDDTINGPGVADMKGGLLVMATALEAFERFGRRDALGYTVLVSPDEEIGSPASAPEIARIGAQSHAGLTYEPALADGGLAGARKGSGNFTVVVRGRSAHAGREHHLGRNALEAAAAFITALQGLNGAREGVTFNVGKVDGGGAVNVVPDLAIVRFNTRMTLPEDTVWIESELARLVALIDARDGISAELHGGFTRPPKPMAPANAALFDWTRRAGATLGLDVRWKATGGVCEGNNLWAAGCPNVDTLGVRGGDIHSDREFVKLSSFAERAKLSALLLLNFASGALDVRSLRSL